MLPDDELRPLEDRAILEALALQEEVGLPVVTDGEYRRRFFFSTIEVLFDGIDPTGFVRHHQDFEGVQHELRTPTPVARLSRRGYARRVRGRVRARAHREARQGDAALPVDVPELLVGGRFEQGVRRPRRRTSSTSSS